jgi:hypothetical protein
MCLGLYISYIKVIWLPDFLGKSIASQQTYGPAGTDFGLFWTASYLALHGETAAIYDPVRLEQRERELTGIPEGHAWLYPPIYLLIVLPLSLLPFHASLVAWLSITLTGYLLVLRRIFPHPLTIFWALGFPGIAINFMVGHNGFLSGALLGGGLVCLNSSPVAAGILLSALLYKPQLGVLVLLALVAGRQWKALGVMLATAACLALVSTLVFGYASWIGFLKNIPFAERLTDMTLYLRKMPTVYALTRLAGLEPKGAWILQLVFSLAVIIMVWRVWSQKSSMAVRAAILVLGTLLFTRYSFHYDYALLAIPLAWLWQEGQANGWLSWEQPLLLCGWIAPLPGMVLSVELDWPMGATLLPIPLVLFILVLRRNYKEIRQVGGAASL